MPSAPAQALNDATEKVKEKSCYALEAFCENMGDDILPFLAPLVTRLTELLRCSSRRTQEMSVSAIASVAMAAEREFAPYYGGVYEMMRTLLQQTGESELLLRAHAMECVGLMNLAVGRAHCEAAGVLPECTALAMQGLQLDLPELREYTYGFFAQVAELLGDDASPLLEPLMPFLLRSLDSEDCIEISDGKGEGHEAGLAQALAGLRGGDGDGDGDGDDDDDDDDDDDGNAHLSIRTALLDEKAAAAHCLGSCAKHCPRGFAPHIERTLTSLAEASDYFHEDVRGAVSHALASLLSSCVAVDPPPHGPWEKGGSADPAQLGTPTRLLLAKVLPLLVGRFEEDEDKDTVAAASEAIAQVATTLGPAAVESVAGKLTKVSVRLLEQEHACQAEAGGDDPDGLDGETDHDGGLWEGVSELLTTLPKVLGSRWLKHYMTIHPKLLPYLADGHPASDKSLAIGVMAESLHQLEGAGAGFFAQTLPLALRCSNDAEDVTVRQNGTFCLGVLGLYAGEAALPQMQAILTALQPRLAADEEESVRDNAVGALARLATGFGASLPLDVILPAIMTHLPLRGDPGENVPAIRCLMKLSADEGTRAAAGQHMGALLSIFGRTFADPKLGLDGSDELADLRVEMCTFLGWLRGLAAEQLEAGVGALPEPERAAIVDAMRRATPS